MILKPKEIKIILSNVELRGKCEMKEENYPNKFALKTY